jgi:hypothetical protein
VYFEKNWKGELAHIHSFLHIMSLFYTETTLKSRKMQNSGSDPAQDCKSGGRRRLVFSQNSIFCGFLTRFPRFQLFWPCFPPFWGFWGA